MLYTLHRFLFVELLKVFLLALVALTLILCLGSIIQPVQQYGVGPRQVVSLMSYFLPIILTFVLPMAALFAGALVYGRFTSDNELDACRASGISILRLVYPGLFLAVIVAIANLLLSFYVMPIFVHLAEKSLNADVKQILFRNIQQKGFYEVSFGKYQSMIYADQADPQNDRLSGVVLTEIKEGKIRKITTTDDAFIKFITRQNANEVQVTTKNTYQMDSAGSTFSSGSSVFSYKFGSLLGDDIKFKNIDQMHKIKADLMLFEPISQKADNTYSQLLLELIAQDIRSRISKAALVTTSRSGSSYEIPGEPNSVRFTADQCILQADQVNLSGQMVITEFDTNSRRPLRSLSCKQASLYIDSNKSSPSLIMDIPSARIEQTGELRMRHIIRGLAASTDVQKITRLFRTEKGSLNPEKLTADPSGLSGFKASSELRALQNGLHREIQRTLLQIKAEIHSRLVFGVGCIWMILIGIGLGIIKKGGHLLSAFGASCAPAAVLIVGILGGRQITQNMNVQVISGIALMWAGLGFLCLLTIVIYYRLLKN